MSKVTPGYTKVTPFFELGVTLELPINTNKNRYKCIRLHQLHLTYI